MYEYLFLQVAWGDGLRTLSVTKMPSNGSAPLKFTRTGTGESPGDGFIHFLNDLGQLGWEVRTYAPTHVPRVQANSPATWARSTSSEFEPPAGAYLLERTARAPGEEPDGAAAGGAALGERRSGALESAYWEAQQESEYVVSLDKVRGLLTRAHTRLAEPAQPERQ